VTAINSHLPNSTEKGEFLACLVTVSHQL